MVNIINIVKHLPSQQTVNNVYKLPSITQTIEYLHVTAGFPIKARWIKAIKAGFYTELSLFTITTVNKHFPESDETVKGHMKGQCQHARASNWTDQAPSQIEDSPRLGEKNDEVYIKVYQTKEKVFMDQTGCSSYDLSKRDQYIMVMVNLDSKYIDCKPNLVMWKWFTANINVQSTKHILDNKAPDDFKTAVSTSGKQEASVTKCTIQTFQSQMISILMGHLHILSNTFMGSTPSTNGAHLKFDLGNQYSPLHVCMVINSWWVWFCGPHSCANMCAV